MPIGQLLEGPDEGQWDWGPSFQLSEELPNPSPFAIAGGHGIAVSFKTLAGPAPFFRVLYPAN